MRRVAEDEHASGDDDALRERDPLLLGVDSVGESLVHGQHEREQQVGQVEAVREAAGRADVASLRTQAQPEHAVLQHACAVRLRSDFLQRAHPRSENS